MRRIFKKLSGILLLFIAIVIWCAYSYNQGENSALTSSGVLSNTKIRLGDKKSGKS
ncbi:MAG: hypothetical protein HFJ50_01735 [Clostridia bacterium]|nr:hypothetical protein [Clostridia bacterium]